MNGDSTVSSRMLKAYPNYLEGWAMVSDLYRPGVDSFMDVGVYPYRFLACFFGGLI